MNRFLLAALSLLTLLATACSASDDPTAPATGDSDLLTRATPTAEVCANHEAGCPCDAPGDLIDCGRVVRRAGDYVWCSTGMQTCTKKRVWAECTGDATVSPAGPTAP